MAQARRKILLRIASCPYCQKAEAALDRAGISYEKFDISSGDRSLVMLLSGQPSVPVLVDVVGGANQDDDILDYINSLGKK
jgi:glutaredoxin